jgi:hypothetical protein
MKNFQYILLISFFFVAFNVNAQKNYKKGYVVLGSGDTLRGMIDYRNWDTFFKKISFIDSKNKEKNYHVTNLKCFFVQEVNETYHSYIGKVDNSRGKNLSFNTLSDFLNFSEITISDTLFVRELIGTKQIMFFTSRDAIGNPHFFISKDNLEIKYLMYHEFLLYAKQGGKTFYPVKRYRQEMLSYLGDCENIVKELDKLAYTEESMKKIFLYYSQCKGYSKEILLQNEAVSKKDRQKLSFGVVGGLALNSYSFYSTLASYRYPVNPTPMFGVFVDFPISRNFQRLSINNQLMYYSFNAKAEKLPPTSPIDVIDKKGSYIKNNLLIKYKFLPLKKISPFVKGGISLGYQLLAEEPSTITNRNVSTGLLFGLGIDAKRTSIFVMYEYNSVSAVITENLRILSFNISYSLLFKK